MRDDELGYLRRLEQYAKAVAHEAAVEGWLTFLEDEEAGQTPLQRSINAMARNVRFQHYDGDGCLDHSDVDLQPD